MFFVKEAESLKQQVGVEAKHFVPKHHFAMVLKKKKRLQLAAVMDQAKHARFEAYSSPSFQSALRLYVLADATSINLRRLISFSLYESLLFDFPTVEVMKAQLKFLTPMQIVMTPRYQLQYKEGAAAALDKWHYAYKVLAEPYVRTRF